MAYLKTSPKLPVNITARFPTFFPAKFFLNDSIYVSLLP